MKQNLIGIKSSKKKNPIDFSEQYLNWFSCFFQKLKKKLDWKKSKLIELILVSQQCES